MNFNAIRKNVGVILLIEAGFMLPPYRMETDRATFAP